MSVIIGIDPGIAQTGFGVIDADSSRFRHITHGTIQTASDKTTGQRLLKIHRGITDILHTYKPEMGGVECLYFARNISSAMPVAQARGVVLLAFEEEGVLAKEYPPQEIKQAITGSGRAEKIQVQELVRIILGLENIPRPDHAADALAAAICCYNAEITHARLAQA